MPGERAASGPVLSGPVLSGPVLSGPVLSSTVPSSGAANDLPGMVILPSA